MRTQRPTPILDQKLFTPRETPADRRRREARSMQVARQMLNNGCCTNTVSRYTGLGEEALRAL